MGDVLEIHIGEVASAGAQVGRALGQLLIVPLAAIAKRQGMLSQEENSKKCHILGNGGNKRQLEKQ